MHIFGNISGKEDHCSDLQLIVERFREIENTYLSICIMLTSAVMFITKIIFIATNSSINFFSLQFVREDHKQRMKIKRTVNYALKLSKPCLLPFCKNVQNERGALQIFLRHPYESLSNDLRK